MLIFDRGGSHKTFGDPRYHITGEFLPLTLGLRRVHFIAPSWSIPPDYLEEDAAGVKGGADTVKKVRGFGLK